MSDDGRTLRKCDGGTLVFGCGSGRQPKIAVEEAHVCGEFTGQDFSASTEAAMFGGGGLPANLLAQRMWYDSGTSAYVVVTKSRHDCGAGETITTTPYSKTVNVDTPTAGTPTTASRAGWRTFKAPAGSGLWGVTKP